MSTSSAASSSQDETDTAPSLKDSEIGVSRRPIQHSIVGHTVSNSSMSTLDRSQYQHISQSGTRRITVQFSNMKIVVPWKETLHTTVRQLADAALIRYKRAKGLPKEDESIRVLRLECVSDGGVLDMEDELEDVFDMAFDQILAITDEPMYATPHRFQPPSQQNHYAQPIPMTQSRFKEVASPEGLRSAVLSESPGTSKSRVTLSPEVEKRLIEGEERKQKYEKNSRLQRGSDRKSRINDAFMDARDRLTEKMEKLEVDTSKMSKKEVVRGPLMPGSVEGTTIVTILAQEELKGADEREIATECGVGMEVNAVYEDISASTSESGTMTAVQVMKIDKNGRVALDGRIRVGDNIVEIDGKPVSQISIFRARRILNECENREIRFTIGRPIESFAEDDAKPIFSALQQANTQYIGHTTIVELIKSSNGFGFTVTGRETAKGDRLFYIGTVRPNGVALGHLKSGDRLLEVNGESTSTMTQSQIVDKLKEAMVGSRVKFLVSRVSTASQKDSSENKENKENKENEKADKAAGPIRFELVIPLNDTGSAGLGVSLKARVSVKKDGQRHDCGVFIKNVMHGGAAFKDGRLQINDRIVGIENIDLEGMSNSKASEELTRKLKSIGPNSSNVRLVIIRDSESNLKCGPVSRDSSRITIDASSPAPSAFTTSTDAAASPHARMPSSSSSSSSAMLAHSRQSSAASSVAALQHVRRTGRESIVSTSTRMDDSEIVAGSLDPFDREAPGRKSLSEKRGMGAAADPQHIKLFQEIKHQRQNSAPPTSRASEKRSKSSQPRSHSQRMSRNAYKTSDDIPEPPVQQLSTDEGLFHRRSQSMESINRPVGSVLRGVAPAKPGVQFVGGVGVDHPFPPGSPILRPKDDMRSRDKSKRKSVGNAMKNFFGFGSKSRDSSPEKSPVQLKSAAARNDEVYSRSHENPTACMEFGDAPRYQHMLNGADIRLLSFSKRSSTPSPPISPTMSIGNSSFYTSLRGRTRSRPSDMNHTPIRNSTTDTPRIDTCHHRRETTQHRPMSTMDYQHLVRMAANQRSEEASHRRACDAPYLNTKTRPATTTPTDALQLPETTTMYSIRGSRTTAEAESEPRLSSNNRMDHRFGSPLHNPSSAEIHLPQASRGKEAAVDAALPSRRKSMLMADDLEEDRRECSFRDTAEDSRRQRSGSNQLEARRQMSLNEERRLIVFPNSRFPIASSSMRVTPSRGKLPKSSMITNSLNFITFNSPQNENENLRRPMNVKNAVNSMERMSLRARKKLHRKSEYIEDSPCDIDKIASRLLPPSTSSIMSTDSMVDIPIVRKTRAH